MLLLSAIIVIIFTYSSTLSVTNLNPIQLSANAQVSSTTTNNNTGNVINGNNNTTSTAAQQNRTTGTTRGVNTGGNNSNITNAAITSPSGSSSNGTNNTTTTAANLNRTGFSYVYNVTISNKIYPVKYNTTGGNLLGIVADKGSGTLVAVIGSATDGGKLVIELPRNVIDDKGQGNADAKFTTKIEGKEVNYKEIGTSKNARILQIDFGKNDKVIEITGTHMAS